MDTQLKNKIESAFKMIPDTKLAIFEGEDGDIFAYGHVDKSDFIEDVLHIWDYFYMRKENIEDFGLPRVGDIEYRHAHLIKDDFDPDQDDLYFTFCGSGHPEAFPLTTYSY